MRATLFHIFKGNAAAEALSAAGAFKGHRDSEDNGHYVSGFPQLTLVD